VRTCEECGADAVDARGICQNCGWEMQAMDDDAPSLGETRAADIPTTVAGNRGRVTPPVQPSGVASPPLFERTVDMPRYATPPSRPTRNNATSMTGTQGTSRYCGTCGARIERGEVFCGQCGTPVGASGNNFGNAGGRSAVGGSPSRYFVGDEEMWSPTQGDALTEAYVPSPPPPMPARYNQGMASAPYHQGYGTPAPLAGQPANASARTARIVWGVICLAASLLTAGAAVLVFLVAK